LDEVIISKSKSTVEIEIDKNISHTLSGGVPWIYAKRFINDFSKNAIY
jgi:hypothetical protein